MLGINPFDEPNVSSAKKITNTYLQRYQDEGALPAEEPYFAEDNVNLYADEQFGSILDAICEQRHYDSTQLEGLLAAHMSLATSGNYIGLLAYLESTEVNHKTLENIRRRLASYNQTCCDTWLWPAVIYIPQVNFIKAAQTTGFSFKLLLMIILHYQFLINPIVLAF